MVSDGTLTHSPGPAGGECDGEPVVATTGAGGAVALSPAAIATMRHLLGRLDPALDSPEPRAEDSVDGTHGLSEAQCIDLLRELEDLKAAAAGAQVAITAHLSGARHDAEAAAGVAAAKRGKGLAGEVALARRLSPYRGGKHLGMARALCADMPCTLAALRTGELSEWRATLLVRESICLSAQQRRDFDSELWRDRCALLSAGDQRLVAMPSSSPTRLAPPTSAAGRPGPNPHRSVG